MLFEKVKVRIACSGLFFCLCLTWDCVLRAEGISGSELDIPLENTTVENEVDVGGRDWQLCGVAEVYAFTLFSVGETSLWLRNCDVDMAQVYTSEKKLTFVYSRHIPGYAFKKAAAHYLKKNLSENRFQRVEQSIDLIGDAYQDVKKGDQYTMLFDTTGLSLFLNGVKLQTVKEPSFAQDYFLIWFGEHPFNKKMKSSLLEPFQKH